MRCTVGAGGQRARSLRRHLEVGLGVESKEEGRVETLLLDGCAAKKRKTVYSISPLILNLVQFAVTVDLDIA